MTADLVITGSAAFAHRHHVGPAPNVDRWGIIPRDGRDPWALITEIDADGFVIYQLNENDDHPDFAERLPVTCPADARHVTERLARQAADGRLPAPPCGEDARAAWRAVITALASALHSVAVAPI